MEDRQLMSPLTTDANPGGATAVDPLRIALMIWPTHGYHRGVLRGIHHYVREQRLGRTQTGRRWVCSIRPSHPDGFDAVRSWNPHGVIADLSHPESVKLVTDLGRPTVNISNVIRTGLPRVGPDEAGIGRLAAEHLLERGFRTFAYWGVAGKTFSDERATAFIKTISERGLSVQRFEGPASRESEVWALGIDATRQWVASLPRPVGILAACDTWAYELAEICRQAGVRIPEDAALLGVDDDDLFCSLVWPPLSSVIVPTERIGHQAATLLGKMLSGGAAPVDPVLLPSPGISTRHSSDVYAMQDPELAVATAYIRAHAHERISVEDILRHVSVSRSTMEHRFRTVLGRTMLDEIRRVRVERARELLGNTNLKIAAVAKRTGFGNQARFCVVFRQETGQTPGEYRNAFSITQQSSADEDEKLPRRKSRGRPKRPQ